MAFSVTSVQDCPETPPVSVNLAGGGSPGTIIQPSTDWTPWFKAILGLGVIYLAATFLRK